MKRRLAGEARAGLAEFVKGLAERPIGLHGLTDYDIARKAQDALKWDVSREQVYATRHRLGICSGVRNPKRDHAADIKAIAEAVATLWDFVNGQPSGGKLPDLPPDVVDLAGGPLLFPRIPDERADNAESDAKPKRETKSKRQPKTPIADAGGAGRSRVRRKPGSAAAGKTRKPRKPCRVVNK